MLELGHGSNSRLLIVWNSALLCHYYYSYYDAFQMDGSSGRENGASETMTAVAHSDEGSLEGQGSDGGDAQKTRAAIEHLKAKMEKTREMIRREQTQKESECVDYGA